MNQFVESLKRLYKNNKINNDKIDKLRSDGKISVSEKKYILSE